MRQLSLRADAIDELRTGRRSTPCWPRVASASRRDVWHGPCVVCNP